MTNSAIQQTFKAQHDQYEKYGDEIPASAQQKVTNSLVAAALAYRVVEDCPDLQKMETKKRNAQITKEATKLTEQEFQQKGIDWLDRKKIQQEVIALIEAQI